ncbi:Xaa-Pro peptidase family protein [Candidatus Babeliales bacterium]|nr:Xaa-Pro peptidase family protein [Candidatus Babeliales bacterium]
MLTHDYARFKNRRKNLREFIKQQYPELTKGVFILPAGFEQERHRFRQESSFFYLTGLHEPAAVLCVYLDGREVLYLPNFGNERKKWVEVYVDTSTSPEHIGVDSICHLSEPVRGYSYSPFFDSASYQHLLKDLKEYVGSDATLFTVLDTNAPYFEQIKLVEQWLQHMPQLKERVQDVSPVLHHMRRIKDDHELSMLTKAVAITEQAQYNALKMMKPGVFEYQIQAIIEHTFIEQGASRSSFPSIVASGKNSTVLHYTASSRQLEMNDLVVVDIGAEYGHYAADLTRTYPVGGVFTPRQREVYQAVLDTQEHIAKLAKPGMFLRNAQKKEQSLHYLAVEFLRAAGFADYFPHGLGHYLGLDVHDVGDYARSLEVGDVFTIEPGIYIAAESLGVRIEDDYVMCANGAECLSAALPKTIDEIEALMKL